MKSIRLFCIEVFLFSFFSTVVFAQVPTLGAGVHISLSEIDACDENEWIELYIDTDTAISWKLEKISPVYKLLSNPPVATVSGKYQKVWEGKSTLTDTGFTLRLTDENGTLIEEKEFKTEKCIDGTSWIKEGSDWKLTTAVTAGDQNNYVALATPTPSPTPSPSATSTPTPSPTPTPTSTPGPQPTSVTLSEIYACQSDGAKEWVELANNASNAVTLTNWKLTDDDGNDQPIPSLTIGSKGYSTVDISKYSKGMLTNSGDVVNLIDANGKKVDSYGYDSCHTDQTWAKSGGDWIETTSITKGAVNPTAHSTATPTASSSGLLEGDGGGEMSGSVLGSETTVPSSDPVVSTPTPQNSSSSSLNTLLSIAFIVLGMGMLGGIGGYLAWEPYLKKRILPLLRKVHTV